MDIPQDRKYLESHEWVLVDGDSATIGITQLAADQLSDITYVELPAVGSTVSAGQPFGEIESVKATSELFSGVSGTVTETNGSLEDQPEQVNNDPYNAGWMLKVKLGNLDDIERLWNATQYQEKYKDGA